MDLSHLEYPKKSHRKVINIPAESQDLAELMGIEFGDGGINNQWQLVITLSSIKDQKYSDYVSYLLRRLFQINVVVKERVGHRILVRCSSTSLVDFLVQKGAVRGNKIEQEIDIPDWIGRNRIFQRFFVRGLMDTDGCLYVHKHTVSEKKYSNIGLCFTSYSRPLIQSVANIFVDNNITPHIRDDGRRIYLYKTNSVVQYLKVFGSSNPRILQKFIDWRDG